MHLQVEIEESDRLYFRILWRYLDSSHKPDVYEFSREVLRNCVQWRLSLLFKKMPEDTNISIHWQPKL